MLIQGMGEISCLFNSMPGFSLLKQKIMILSMYQFKRACARSRRVSPLLLKTDSLFLCAETEGDAFDLVSIL